MADCIDGLQVELGGGREWVAARIGKVVQASDVHSDPHHDWPIFGTAVDEPPVGALFCVPLKMGAVSLGAATLYRAWLGRLRLYQQISALAIASATASTVVHRVMRSTVDDAPADSIAMSAFHREVHHATGMILVQIITNLTIAYARLPAYAFASGRTAQSVAHDVVHHTLIFDAQNP